MGRVLRCRLPYLLGLPPDPRYLLSLDVVTGHCCFLYIDRLEYRHGPVIESVLWFSKDKKKTCQAPLRERMTPPVMATSQ